MLALTRDELDDCIKPELLAEWNDQIRPKWFATKCPKSQKEPGLLKEEARITRGWFLAPSPKCYILAQMEPNDLEKEFLTSKDPFKVLKTWNQSTEPKNEIKKRSSKGCKRSINLSYVNVFYQFLSIIFSVFEYMQAVFATNLDDRICKDIPQIQMNRKNDRMETSTMNKKTVNPVYLKRKILSDRISTEPLQKRSDGSFL